MISVTCYGTNIWTKLHLNVFIFSPYPRLQIWKEEMELIHFGNVNLPEEVDRWRAGELQWSLAVAARGRENVSTRETRLLAEEVSWQWMSPSPPCRPYIYMKNNKKTQIPKYLEALNPDVAWGRSQRVLAYVTFIYMYCSAVMVFRRMCLVINVLLGSFQASADIYVTFRPELGLGFRFRYL